MDPAVRTLVIERLTRMPESVVASLLRIGRRIQQGFEGEITISVKRGGVSFIRWVETETGATIKEELG